MEITEIQAQPVVAIRTTTTMEGISNALHEILPAVWGHVTSHGGQPAGPPFTRYYSWDGASTDMEAGIPVAAPVPGEGRIVSTELPAGKVARAIHVGSYEKLSDTYRALESYIKEQGLTPAGAVWEVYLTDPGQEPDTSTWKTEINWPVSDGK